VATFSDNYQLPTTFEVLGFTDRRLPEDVEVNLYRIAQEALNNAYKHAQATRADVLLQASGSRVILTVTDNGVGFLADVTGERDLRDRRMGLDGMKERAALVGGSLTIETQPGDGTSVIAIVPANA
jgi:signal transduction histidine kinase